MVICRQTDACRECAVYGDVGQSNAAGNFFRGFDLHAIRAIVIRSPDVLSAVDATYCIPLTAQDDHDSLCLAAPFNFLHTVPLPRADYVL